MIDLEFKKLRKVLLIGAGGKTGFWYSRLLIDDGLEIYAYDQNPQIKYDPELISSQSFHIVNQNEFENFEILKNIDSVTFSPGVYIKQPVIQEAIKQKKNIFSELEYCYERLHDRKWICITGTDGKSTTVALTEHCLNQFNIKAIACGNYGLSFSRILYENENYKKYNVLVAELSSYQLELCRNLESDISIFLNLAPDHLNRYADLEDYGLAKWNIALSVKKDGLVLLNKSLSPSETNLWKNNHPIKNISQDHEVILIDTSKLISKNFSYKAKYFLFNNNNQKIIKSEKLQIHGSHNYSNILFALEVLNYFSCKDIEKISDSLSSFKSLPHRYEKIDIGDDNIYINDSKATTTQAAIIAVNNSKKPLFVFIGGRSKGEDYTELARVIQNARANVFLFGENRNQLAEVFRKIGYEISGITETLSEIFQVAVSYQKLNQISKVTYLLSPASTSWDQYSSFEERGDMFKKIVAGLVN